MATSTVSKVSMVAAGFFLALALGAVGGCGGSQSSPKTAESEESVDDPATEPAAQSSEAETSPYEASSSRESSDGRVSEMGEMAPPVPEAWELGPSVCQDLRSSYESLMLEDEMAKVEKRNPTQKQRKSMENNAHNVSKQGADNWYRACQDIVGTIQVRERWDCAGKATTLERFKGCIDGKFDAELNIGR